MSIDMGGDHHSYDLVMYLKRQLTGLARNTTTSLDVTVTIDSNAPATCGGMGGSPDESAFVKDRRRAVQARSCRDRCNVPLARSTMA